MPMADTSHDQSRHATVWIMGLLLFALGVRLAYNIWWIGIHNSPISDALNYHNLGIELIESGSYSNLLRAPGLPFLVAGIYEVFGVEPFFVRMVLSIIGALTCGLIYLIGREAFGWRVGKWAAWASTVYIFLFYWNGYLLTETLFTFWLCLFIWLLLKGRNKPHTRYWIIAGFVLGLATLTRPITLTFGPFLMLWAVISFYPKIKYALTVTGLISGIMVLTIMPWTIRNYYATGVLVPVTWAAGNVLLGANNPNVLDYFPGGWVPPLKSGLITEAEQAGLTEVEIDRLYTQKTLTFIWENPFYIIKLCVYKFKLFWHLHRAIDPESIQYILAAISAALGAYTARSSWRHISILYIIPIFFTFVALVFWGDDRMRSPVEPVLLVFAAFTWDRYAKGLRKD